MPSPKAGENSGYTAARSTSPAAAIARPRAGAPRRAVAVPHGDQQRRRLPPQEEGLFSNSWNGKFHLEMHAWHAAHFAVWGRPELLERSLPGISTQLPAAQARAKAHGCGRLVAQDGRARRAGEPEQGQSLHHVAAAASDLPGGSALQGQAHARDAGEIPRDGLGDRGAARELAVHDRKARALRARSADDSRAGEFRAAGTFNPTFELEYSRLGLAHRAGMARAAGNEEDRNGTRAVPPSKLPDKDGIYLAAESQQDLWERARSPNAQGQHEA